MLVKKIVKNKRKKVELTTIRNIITNYNRSELTLNFFRTSQKMGLLIFENSLIMNITLVRLVYFPFR